ncbi:MAG: septum formation initiator family protein [Candidatus Zophobacter franzmannii]|nr:septum formation initiator family protein [Candidatus Zophobacter franzmannii]
MKGRHERIKKSTLRIEFISLFIVAIYLAFFDHYNVVKVANTKIRAHRLNRQISKLEKENEEIAKKNDSLVNDYDEVERIAREDYNYREENETEVRFIDRKELK